MTDLLLNYELKQFESKRSKARDRKQEIESKRSKARDRKQEFESKIESKSSNIQNLKEKSCYNNSKTSFKNP